MPKISVPLFRDTRWGLLRVSLYLCSAVTRAIVDTASSKILVAKQDQQKNQNDAACALMHPSQERFQYQTLSVKANKPVEAIHMGWGDVSSSSHYGNAWAPEGSVYFVDEILEGAFENLIGLSPHNKLGIRKFEIRLDDHVPVIHLGELSQEFSPRYHAEFALLENEKRDWWIVEMSVRPDKEPYWINVKVCLDSGSSGIFVPPKYAHWKSLEFFQPEAPTHLGHEYLIDPSLRCSTTDIILLGIPFFNGRRIFFDADEKKVWISVFPQ